MATIAETGFSENEIKDFLQSVIKEAGITSEEFHVSKGFEKGDGYMSFVLKVDIIGGKDLHLVIKCPPKSEQFRKTMPVRQCFVREIDFYEVIYPALQNFQEEKNVDRPFQCVAKCYKTDNKVNKELVVLQNIKAEGFRMWNSKLVMDDAHVSLVLNEYGKFHAISAALKQQNRAKFDELSQLLKNLFTSETFPESLFEMAVEHQVKTKELFSSQNEKEIYDKLDKFQNEILELFNRTKEYLGEYCVILHGDCWSNNMLFKYGDSENSSKPTELRLIDFQAVKVGSPVFDLSTFFYSAASKEVLDNLDHYLRVYHNSFTQYMIDLGSDPGEYSFKAFKGDWEMFSKYGYITAQIRIKAMLKDEDEIIDSTDDTDFVSSLNKDTRYKHVIDERLRNISLHMYENDLL